MREIDSYGRIEISAYSSPLSISESLLAAGGKCISIIKL